MNNYSKNHFLLDNTLQKSTIKIFFKILSKYQVMLFKCVSNINTINKSALAKIAFTQS